MSAPKVNRMRSKPPLSPPHTIPRGSVPPAQQQTSRRQRDGAVALFLLGWLLVGYPLLAAAAHWGVLFSLPALYVYLFGAWLLLIVLIAALAEGVR